jgi:putative membrane protein
MRKEKYLAFLLIIYVAALTWSAINPKDYFTWILEVSPGIAGLVLLAATYPRLRFTVTLSGPVHSLVHKRNV